MGVIKYKNKTYGGGNGGSGSDAIECTQVEYDALEAEGKLKADTFYLIKDGVADGDIVSNVDLLWTNPDPTSTFPIQTLPINHEEYSFLFVVCKVVHDWEMYSTCIVKTGILSRLQVVNANIIVRPIDLRDRTKITFQEGVEYSSYNANPVTDSTYCIPVEIYGLKDIGSTSSVIGGNTNLGDADISDIGDGTVTGAISEIHTKYSEVEYLTLSASLLTGGVNIAKRNGICTVSYHGDCNAAPVGDLGVLFTLPEGFRPAIKLSTMCMPNCEIQVTFNQNGNVEAYNYTNAFTGVFPNRFTITYPVED